MYKFLSQSATASKVCHAHVYTTGVVHVAYLSMLIAVRLRIDDVQHITSNATHVSHNSSPNRQMEPFTCISRCVANREDSTVSQCNNNLYLQRMQITVQRQ